MKLILLTEYVNATKFLIEHNTDVNVKDNNGFTPLHAVAIYGPESVAKLLIEYGANVSATDYRRCTPLHWTAQHSHRPYATNIAKLLIAHGADVNAKDNHNNTPLISVAAEAGKFYPFINFQMFI